MYYHITDYDGTIMPYLYPEEYQKGCATVYRDFIKENKDIKVIYSSGRIVESTLQEIEKHDLPKPDYVFGGIGSQIYDYKKQSFIEGHNKDIDADKFDAEKIMDLLRAQGRPLADFNNKHKICCSFLNPTPEKLTKLQNEIEEMGIKAALYLSGADILDIVPKSVSKAKPIKYIVDLLGLDYSDIIVSGDSHNDIDMYKVKAGGKILLPNAEDKLKNEIKDMENIIAVKEKYAFGVVEGLKKFISK